MRDWCEYAVAMGQKLPVISGRDAVRALAKAGFVQIAGGKGSHMKLVHPERRLVLIIPDHRELRPGLLRALIRDAGMTVDQFAELL